MIKAKAQQQDEEALRQARLSDLLVRIAAGLKDLASTQDLSKDDYQRQVRTVAEIMVNHYGADAAGVATELQKKMPSSEFPRFVLAEVERMLRDLKCGGETIN